MQARADGEYLSNGQRGRRRSFRPPAILWYGFCFVKTAFGNAFDTECSILLLRPPDLARSVSSSEPPTQGFHELFWVWRRAPPTLDSRPSLRDLRESGSVAHADSRGKLLGSSRGRLGAGMYPPAVCLRGLATAALVLLAIHVEQAGCQLIGSSGSTTSLGTVIPPPSCVTKGQKLRRGDCSAFVDYFIGNSQCSSNDQQFKSVVRASPTPDAQCCADALDFVRNSCSCNNAVLASADIIDWDQGSIECVARATIASTDCNGSGANSNPCGNS